MAGGKENLIPQAHVLTVAEQSAGGKASAEARKAKIDYYKNIDIILSHKANPNAIAQIHAALPDIPIDQINNALVGAVSDYNKWLKGDTRAGERINARQNPNIQIKEREMALKEAQWEHEKKQLQTALDTAEEYKGIPVLAIAPCYAQMQHELMRNNHTEYLLFGGRGSTKSSCISLDLIDDIERNEDHNALVVRKVGNTIADSVYNQVVWAIDTLGLNNQYKCKRSPAEITKISTGQKIFFRGADDPIKLKSIKATRGYIAVLWFEELDQFSGEEEIRNIKQSAIRGGDDAKIFMSFNPPKTQMNWANKYAAKPKEKRFVIKADYTMVPREWLGQPFIDEAEELQRTNPNAYEHEYLGIANGNGGNVFERVEAREITDEEINQFERKLYGVDWGWYPDIYAFNKCHWNPAQQTLYIFDEFDGNKLSNEQTAEVLKRQKKVGAEIVTCDSAEPKSIEDYRAMGINARPVEKGAGSIEYSMKWLARAKIVIDPVRCPHTLEEFINYEYERDREGNVISGYPDHDNHHIDAIRYATFQIWKKRGQ